MRIAISVVVVGACAASAPRPSAPASSSSHVGVDQEDANDYDSDPIDDPRPPSPSPSTMTTTASMTPSPMSRRYPEAGNSNPPPVAIAAGPPRAKEAHAELVVRGHEERTIGNLDYELGRVCVRDQARLAARDGAAIVLTSAATSVIAGRGIGPIGDARTKIRIDVPDGATLFVLFDNARTPIAAEFHAAGATVHIAITGSAGLELTGTIGSSHMYAAFGIPSAFPGCQ